MQIPQSRHDKLKVRDESPIHMTQRAFKDLREKLARLKASIPSLATEAGRAADYGDRSENAEYKEAKGKLRGTHRQILVITDQIKRVVVIKSGPDSSGKIRLGSTVVLETPAGEKTFQILGPHETNPDRGIISDQSPLGAALIGRVKGESVVIKTGSGTQAYKVLEIR